jgi:DNA polymerase-3 subunit chi
MAIIQFYHLTQSPLEVALPRLLEKAYQGGFRVHVKVANAELMAALDKSLWTYAQLAFLPHATEMDARPNLQPILLSTTLENKNNATVLCITDDTRVETNVAYEKVIDMFNGQDSEALANARARWKYYQSVGVEMAYFMQTENGWQKKELKAA